MPPKNLQILLADDETEISTLVASVLKRAGHSVEMVDDGAGALELLKENPGRYDVVITDSNMPIVSGIQLIEHLRQTQFPGKIMLLTGYLTSESEEIHDALKIDCIMQKPFSFAALTKAVKELGDALENGRPA